MRDYARRGKNLAALFMLIALVSMLLPFCQIKTTNKTTTISGAQLIKISAKAGKEKIQKGGLSDNYIIGNDITWKDVKESIALIDKSGSMKTVEVVVILAFLPLIFCFLSMCMTLLAGSKKAMYFPTLLIILAFIESFFILKELDALHQMANSYAAQKGANGAEKTIQITSQIGLTLFVIFCGIAMIILLLLWLFHAFDNKNDQNDNDKQKKTKTKKQHQRKHRKNKKKKKKEKEKNSSENKNIVLTGKILCQNGFNKGLQFDLSGQTNSAVIGTTKEAADYLAKGLGGNMKVLENHTLYIKYLADSKKYVVTNHSNAIIYIHSHLHEPVQTLASEATKTIEKEATLFIDTPDNSIYFH